MKILQINNCHYRRGGADVVYLNTGQLLTKMGHQVIYFSQKSKSNHETSSSKYFIEGIDYFNSSIVNRTLLIPRFFYSFEAKNKLEKLIINEKPDITHIHLYKGTLTPSILKTLKKYRVPTILTLHDYGLLCPHNLFIDGKNQICERCVGSTAFNCIIHKCNHSSYALSSVSAVEFIFNNTFFSFDKYFNKIITVSNFALDKHMGAFSEFSDKFTHLYNFYPDLINTPINSIKGGYCLFYSRLSKEKGAITLLKAWCKINKDIKLKIAGTGPEMEALKKIKAEEKLTNVEFLGHIEGYVLDENIKNASFIIVPSEWYENNPLTVIEAYANGKPVITSNAGGLPEIVIDNKTGFLFEMGNSASLSEAILKADNLSTKEYELFSQNARNFAEENFNEKKHYDRLMQIYSEAILKEKENYA